MLHVIFALELIRPVERYKSKGVLGLFAAKLTLLNIKLAEPPNKWRNVVCSKRNSLSRLMEFPARRPANRKYPDPRFEIREEQHDSVFKLEPAEIKTALLDQELF